SGSCESLSLHRLVGRAPANSFSFGADSRAGGRRGVDAKPQIMRLRLACGAPASGKREEAQHLDPLTNRKNEGLARVHRARGAGDAPSIKADMPGRNQRLGKAARARKAQIPQQLVEPYASSRTGARHQSSRAPASRSASPAKGLWGEGPRRAARSPRAAREEV